ncbi:MAG: LacI family DNA-binding transcriptional regulator [Cetobacterium sp.]|uniref:LacI family DNA-binding transcriptional regulator n=1 Tax=Cetobacterium sp. TaxID=2071632 RepID=UPI003F2FC353
MKNKKITMTDIAKLAGVSQPTVSRAINNPHLVKASVREEIEKIIEEYNFIPDENAKTMRGLGSRILGLIVFDFSNYFYLEMVKFAEKIARKKGYTLILMNSEGNSYLEKSHIKTLLARNVEGILIAPVDIKNLDFLRETKIPYTVINNIFENHNCVYTSLEAGGEFACNYLISQGYEKIGYIGNFSEQKNLKLSGFKNALKKNNMSFDEKLMVHINTKTMETNSLETYLKNNSIENCSFVASNDEIAHLFLQAVKNLYGPEKNISIVGFDNTIVSSLMNFSSIEQPMESMIEKAIEILFLNNNQIKQISLEPKLVIRK